MNIEKIKADVTLDLKGISCPLPPLKTAKALKRLEAGQILEVIGTSPVGKRTAPWFAQKLGNELIHSVSENGHYRLYYRKS